MLKSEEMGKYAGNCVSVIIPMSSTGNLLSENTYVHDYEMNKCKYIYVKSCEQCAR